MPVVAGSVYERDHAILSVANALSLFFRNLPDKRCSEQKIFSTREMLNMCKKIRL